MSIPSWFAKQVMTRMGQAAQRGTHRPTRQVRLGVDAFENRIVPAAPTIEIYADKMFTEGSAPIKIAPGGDLNDDDADFDGGTLTASITSGGISSDRIAIATTGGPNPVSTAGGIVFVASTAVGTFTGGTSDTDPLVITFGANSTPAIAHIVSRAITYENVSTDPTNSGANPTRTVVFTVVDTEAISDSDFKTITVTDIANTAPAIIVSGTTTYTENATGVLVSPAAGLTDSDSANFNGGSLVVTLTAGARDTDLLEVRNIGTGAGQVGVSSGVVSYQGVDVGTVSGGNGANSLVVAFNTNDATLTAVRAVLRAIAYSNTSDNPTDFGSSTSRTIQFVANDGDGGVSSGSTKTIAVKAVNDKPVLGGISNASYTVGDGATVLNPSATVADADSANLAFGKLTVQAINAQSPDRFEIQSTGTGMGEVSVVGNLVSYEGIAIGTFSGGTGTSPLVVTFDADATVEAAQAVLRAVTYRNVNSNPTVTSRTIRYTLGDGDGGKSDPVDQMLTISN